MQGGPNNGFNTYKKREHSLEFAYLFSGESPDFGNLIFGERIALRKGIISVNCNSLRYRKLPSRHGCSACAKRTNHLEGNNDLHERTLYGHTVNVVRVNEPILKA
jgi:hypothetical protein